MIVSLLVRVDLSSQSLESGATHAWAAFQLSGSASDPPTEANTMATAWRASEELQMILPAAEEQRLDCYAPAARAGHTSAWRRLEEGT
jgi:hypothetical protein